MALDVASLWDFADVDASERRFREALVGATGDDAIVLQTQLARTLGLRRRFAEARGALEAIEPSMADASAEAKVRFALELGRTHASMAHAPEESTPASREVARSLYRSSFEQARDARLDWLAIDALHMMVAVDTEPHEQLAWDLKAIEYMQRSTQPEAKKWEGSLHHNAGYANHLLGNHEEALVHYRFSLAAQERAGRVVHARIAHWMIARTLRAQEKFAEALDIQLRLEREWDDAGEPDPYVHEELEHLYRATGDAARADAYAAKRRETGDA